MATVSECQPPRAPIVVHGPSTWFDQLKRIRTLEEQLLVARVVWVAQLLVLLNETHEGALAALADPTATLPPRSAVAPSTAAVRLIADVDICMVTYLSHGLSNTGVIRRARRYLRQKWLGLISEKRAGFIWFWLKPFGVQGS